MKIYYHFDAGTPPFPQFALGISVIKISTASRGAPVTSLTHFDTSLINLSFLISSVFSFHKYISTKGIISPIA